MPKFKTLNDFSALGKVVLLRADLNVPLQDGKVSDMTRIDRLTPTIHELCTKGARVVILSHFGRPKGKDDSLSLAPVKEALETALKTSVVFVNDCIGDSVKQKIAQMKNGQILLLENVRFYPEEEKNNQSFANKIAELGDIYVNDAFSAAHRAHASTEGVAHLLPCYAGRLMEAELQALGAALEEPERPVVAIVGGAKISTKIDLLQNLVKKIDTLILGGGMANTFLYAQGFGIGKSLCEKDMSEQARHIMVAAQNAGCKIVLPADAVTAKEFKAMSPSTVRDLSHIQDDDLVLDIGPKTISEIKSILEKSKTILWNGPLGAFETKPFDQGTTSVAAIVAQLTQEKRLKSIAGGGDTVSALAHAGVEQHFSYISTAGGAFLEWLEGKELPGVAALAMR